MLKGEEQGEQGVLLAQHVPGPLQLTGPISSPTSEFSCCSPGQSLYRRGGGLFLASHMPVLYCMLVRQNCCAHTFSQKVLQWGLTLMHIKET